MFSNFKEEARNIIVIAKNEMKKLKHPFVGSEHLLLAILKDNNNISKKLKNYDLTYDSFKKELINVVGVGTKENDLFLYTPLLKRIIESACIDSRENNSGEVTIDHLFSALLEEGEGVAIRILIGMNIDVDELYSEFMYRIVKTKKNGEKRLIEEIGVNLVEKALKNELDPVVGREEEIKRVIEILSRRCKNNPILIGEAGVGKTAIVEQLSYLIANSKVPLNLRGKKIISVDMASLVAGTKYRGEFEDRVKKILNEVEEDPDIILFIDEIHTLVGAGGAEGAIDASNIFKPALARGKFRCIGATTTLEYKNFIEKDKALERRFQKVNIEIPSKEQTKEILKNIKTIYENYHYVTIQDEIIDSIVDLSEKYIYDRNEPDRSLDILDEVAASVNIKEDKNIKKYNELKKEFKLIKEKKEEAVLNNNFDKATEYKEKENIIIDKINVLELNLYKKKNKKVTIEDVARIISKRTKIPVYEILDDNRKIITKMELKIKKEIVGQEEAINKMLNVLKRIKLGFMDNKCYSMLFVGPSGVGKTLLAKTFGSILTNNVIKLDMGEYSEAHSVSKIIGSPPGYVGYEEATNVLEKIRSNPYSVLILDEIERAHPNVINLFLNILDEGKITDSKGNIVRFNQTTIIMTSNIGFLENQVGFGIKENSTIQSKLKEYFNLSFLNRINEVIVFSKLNEKDIEKLIKNKIDKFTLKHNNYDIKINNDVIKEIIKLSNYKESGARKIDKIIEDCLINKVLDEMINKNKTILVNTIKESVI